MNHTDPRIDQAIKILLAYLLQEQPESLTLAEPIKDTIAETRKGTEEIAAPLGEAEVQPLVTPAS